MCNMMNAKFLTLMVAILGGQFVMAYCLSRRIGEEVGRAKGELSGHMDRFLDELSGRIDSIEKLIHSERCRT